MQNITTAHPNDTVAVMIDTANVPGAKAQNIDDAIISPHQTKARVECFMC